MRFDDAICRYAIGGYAICAWDAGDEVIIESYKCINVLSVDGSLVHFFFLES